VGSIRCFTGNACRLFLGISESTVEIRIGSTVLWHMVSCARNGARSINAPISAKVQNRNVCSI
jgi:hypothetical protein